VGPARAYVTPCGVVRRRTAPRHPGRAPSAPRTLLNNARSAERVGRSDAPGVSIGGLAASPNSSDDELARRVAVESAAGGRRWARPTGVFSRVPRPFRCAGVRE
jgi:hypothetical protein